MLVPPYPRAFVCIGTSQYLENLEKIIGYCTKRVFDNQSTSSNQKVLSLSDPDAAYIQKGNRDPVIGYKPQLGRSQYGFVSTLIVPQGNANDAGQLEGRLEDHAQRTERIPHEISVDDGYANEAIRQKWQKKGVTIFSISGAKGKKIISEEEYNSPLYQNSGNGRSAVESLMFTIKHGFDFGEVMRRGMENVRAELMEKRGISFSSGN